MTVNPFLNLAEQGHCLPIGTHLVLHEASDPDAILTDGQRLGAVVVEAAERFDTPLAMPLMDLTVEKEALLRACGVPGAEIGAYHFTELPSEPEEIPPTPRMRATCEAIEYVAGISELLPMGMCIGPYSLLTKLVRDPITPVYLTGMGMTGEDEPDIALIEALLQWSERVIHAYVDAQIAAGARAMIVCEPAANLVYFSPNQMETNPEPFEHFVMEPMQRLTVRLAADHVALVFHDCGELTDDMLRRFATLGAAMISLGSSRDLVHDADLVPADCVLFGNLPSKNFYATQLTSAEVKRMGYELSERMREAGHPFILGTECDVLSVEGKEAEIQRKVNALMQCGCAFHTAGTGTRMAVRMKSAFPPTPSQIS